MEEKVREEEVGVGEEGETAGRCSATELGLRLRDWIWRRAEKGQDLPSQGF